MKKDLRKDMYHALDDYVDAEIALRKLKSDETQETETINRMYRSVAFKLSKFEEALEKVVSK